MHIKLSGIALLGGAALALSFVGFTVVSLLGSQTAANADSAASKTPSITLPQHLAQATDKYHPVYTDRLTTEWSRTTHTKSGFGPSIYVLEEGHFAEVRCNGDDSYRFMVDQNSFLYQNGKRVGETSRWRPCGYVNVRAASPKSVGVPYLVAMTSR